MRKLDIIKTPDTEKNWQREFSIDADGSPRRHVRIKTSIAAA